MKLDALVRLKNRTAGDLFARSELAAWAGQHVATVSRKPARILDVGLGGSEDLLAIRKATSNAAVEIDGLECNTERIVRARKSGIEVFDINIENEAIPLADATLDVLLANHVIEHLKEIFFFFSEVSRVLRPGGLAIIGFPNLGSWHNRLALMFGQQPPCMRVLGSHVRGITIPGFKQFIEKGAFFRVRTIKGRAFYMAPGATNRWLASTLPGLASGVHFVMERTERSGTFIEVLDMDVPGVNDTPYFRG